MQAKESFTKANYTSRQHYNQYIKRSINPIHIYTNHVTKHSNVTIKKYYVVINTLKIKQLKCDIKTTVFKNKIRKFLNTALL